LVFYAGLVAIRARRWLTKLVGTLIPRSVTVNAKG
jgi:hypothetical protein